MWLVRLPAHLAHEKHSSNSPVGRTGWFARCATIFLRGHAFLWTPRGRRYVSRRNAACGARRIFDTHVHWRSTRSTCSLLVYYRILACRPKHHTTKSAVGPTCFLYSRSDDGCRRRGSRAVGAARPRFEVGTNLEWLSGRREFPGCDCRSRCCPLTISAAIRKMPTSPLVFRTRSSVGWRRSRN